MRKIKIVYADAFRKGYKQLCKKLPSLPDDFALFLEALSLSPTGAFAHAVKINNLGEDVYISVYKVKKFPISCIKKTNSGIRLVYAYDDEEKVVELIEFIEIYHKNTQENHDIQLIKQKYKGITDLPSGIGTDEPLDGE